MSDPSYVTGMIGRLEPFEDRPRAENVLRAPEAHVVLFEFAAGQVLREHTARHPVLVQTLAGHTTLSHEGGEFDLPPGAVLHLPAMLPHSVVALEPSTMTVTMLLNHAPEK